MVKLYSVKEMQDLEKEANANGLSYDQMMENAGKGIADEIDIAYSHLPKKTIIAIVGSGNNGGDALVALSHLARNHWDTSAYIVRQRDADDLLITRLTENGGKIINIEGDKKHTQLTKLLNTCSILLDGMFGTGIKLPLKEDAARILRFVKDQISEDPKQIHVVAVDCPSGVDCETGEAAEDTIPAEMTITMAGLKKGLIQFPAANLAGEIRYSSIGAIEKFHAYINNPKLVLTPDVIRSFLPKRPNDAHKGTFGTAFIIAGSVNYTGAALLAGLAAYRSGTGLVTMAVPSSLHVALAGEFPESTWVLLPDELGVIAPEAARVVQENCERATAILVGPGFGLEDPTKEFLSKLFKEIGPSNTGNIGFIHGSQEPQENNFLEKPIVLDADGLKLMSKISNWDKLLKSPAILTPHPGEMSVISGLPVAEIQNQRFEIASQYAQKWGHVIVLKGAFTVIAAPDGQLAVVPVATSALARAGTGDVLAGLIVGLRAQGVEAFQSACAGAWIHANAGLLAAKRMGNTASVIARDVSNAISQVITDLLS